jgi:hypothetical protein
MGLYVVGLSSAHRTTVLGLQSQLTVELGGDKELLSAVV